jgi:hypothetical protein
MVSLQYRPNKFTSIYNMIKHVPEFLHNVLCDDIGFR